MKAKLQSRREAFFEELSGRLLVCDGAMGTVLYNHGIPFTASFDELNLTMPDLVRSIHQEYLEAGADLIETNTFGANRIRLGPHNLENRVRDVNLAGVSLARDVCKDNAWVLGSVGPLGKPLEPVGRISLEEARECFSEQISALVEGGVDFVLLETFNDLREITQALLAAKELGDVPVMAQMTFTEDLKTLMGDKPKEVVQELRKLGAVMVGANCSVGPVGIFEVMEVIASLKETDGVYLSAMPNAGIPRMVGGRYMYLSSPEYTAEYALRLAKLGINVIGGCCGTTPVHIKMIAEKVAKIKPYRRAKKGSAVKWVEDVKPEPDTEKPSSFIERMGTDFLVSVEIDPPRGVDPSRLVDGAIFLKGRGVEAINVADSPLATARMSSLVLGHLIRQATDVELILHLSCRDKNILALQAELMGAHALGIRSILAVTGDPPKLGDHPNATGVFDVDSIGLLKMITRLNEGVDMTGRILKKPTHFHPGAGCNPVEIDMERELDRLHKKIEAGAKYVFTQPLYEISILEKFMHMVDDLKVPFFVGILPLRNAKHAEFLHNEIPEMFIPEKIRERMRKAGENGPDEGVKIAQEFLLEAKDMVRGAYLMPPFNKFEMAADVIKVLN